jgi:hypothetical protein
MGDRVVDCARLESVCAERHRGFESLPIRIIDSELFTQIHVESITIEHNKYTEIRLYPLTCIEAEGWPILFAVFSLSFPGWRAMVSPKHFRPVASTARDKVSLSRARGLFVPDRMVLCALADFTAAFPHRVFGSADRSGADRTWDRAGAVQE